MSTKRKIAIQRERKKIFNATVKDLYEDIATIRIIYPEGGSTQCQQKEN